MPAATPVPDSSIPTVKRPLPCVVSVNVVPLMLPEVAAVAAVVVVVSLIPTWARLVPEPMTASVAGLPLPRPR